MNNPVFSLLAEALGWTVVHSTWQIALIWLVFMLFSRLLRHRNELIYTLSILCMTAAAGWCVLTFAAEFERVSLLQTTLSQLNTIPANTYEFQNVTLESVETTPPVGLLETMTAWLENHIREVGWAWSICVLLLWLRLLGGWWMVQRLRRRDVIQPEAQFTDLCRKLGKQLKINRFVQLLESPHVKEPLTLGFWKPVVLFPAGMLLSLSPAQVEVLLLHELAHIRRYDYLVNLLQLLLETCFFYHPLFRMISRDARARREFCCDDVVLRHSDNPILYAKTLTDLQISFLHPVTQFTMNATGKTRFTERILRIAGISPERESRPNWLIIMLLPLTVAICSWWPSQAAKPDPEIIEPEQISAVVDSVIPRKAAPTANPTPVPTAKLSVMDAKASEPSPDPTVTANATPKVALELVKMNVFYIGVDNPVRVAVEGIPPEELVLKFVGKGEIKGSDGNYTVQVREPGEASILISRRQNGVETEIATQKYRVKRIPDPTVALTSDSRIVKLNSGVISKEKLMEVKNLQAILTNFDFEGNCEVLSYELTILPKQGDPISMIASSSAIPAHAKKIFETLAGDGDAIFFDDIKVKCSGDSNARNMGGTAFKVQPDSK